MVENHRAPASIQERHPRSSKKMTETQGLQWTDAFLLGYEPMDDTHREFVEIVDKLLTCPDAEMAGLLQAFITHAEAHLASKTPGWRKPAFHRAIATSPNTRR
jgi:hypothetical protein